MTEGDISLTVLPQADGQRKNRPVVVLRKMPPFDDWLVCGVSTQLHQAVAGFDDAVHVGDADYTASGLKASSLIRLGFLAVIPETQLLGAIGALAPQRHRRLLDRLSEHLSAGRPEDQSTI